MDRRRSFYLASREDDFYVPAPDEDSVKLTDAPFVTPANDNFRVKDGLSARCRALFRRLDFLSRADERRRYFERIINTEYPVVRRRRPLGFLSCALIVAGAAIFLIRDITTVGGMLAVIGVVVIVCAASLYPRLRGTPF
jgi:hypothetical protein